jgi:hypothetical protein
LRNFLDRGDRPQSTAQSQIRAVIDLDSPPTRTERRNWTTALLAFKPHFGDRLPDTAT